LLHGNAWATELVSLTVTMTLWHILCQIFQFG
jgi:hypothetical protein